jgi:hypothetical protein
MSRRLDDMREEVQDKRELVAALDRELRDYYTRRRRLQHAIIETFEHVVDDSGIWPRVVVTRYSREGRAERASLFTELDRLNEVFAPTIKERRNLSIEADSLARAIERIAAWEAKHPQRDLFAEVP